MKKGMKRLVSCLLAIAMVLTTFGVNTKTALAEERTMQNYVYNGYEVTFDVTDAWDGAFNAEVKIANTGDAEICDWALTFEFAHEIQNLWNATAVEHTGNTYVIKNADWNANIKPGEGVAFGMTVLCDGEIALPENFSFVMKEESVTAQSYSAEFTLYSDWGTGCNGAIILSNLTDEPIENWQLEFDYDREIVDIANAVIVSHEQNHYVIKNAEYNADIAANSSVHISIVAGEGLAEERPENFTMQQTVMGDVSTGTEDGNEEIPDDDENDEVYLPKELQFYVYGSYNSNTGSIEVEWHAENKLSNYHVLISSNNVLYQELAQVDEQTTYSWLLQDDFDMMYIKVTANNEEGELVETLPCVIERGDYGYEVKLFDTDNDSIPDLFEIMIGTDENLPDTDGDGLTDSQEIYITASDPTVYDSIEKGVSDSEADYDGDMLSSEVEIEYGTNPLEVDTDGDDLSDSEEVLKYNTNPASIDSDKDGLSDGEEVLLGLDPNNPMTFGVLDSEYQIKQSISADSKVFENVNKKDNPYQISLEITAAGYAEGRMKVQESDYTGVITNDAMLGCMTELSYDMGESIDSVSLRFDIDESFTENSLGIDSGMEELAGIKRFNVFKYFEEINMLLPIETKFEEGSNVIYAEVDELGTYCVMDVETWLYGLNMAINEEDNVQTVYALKRNQGLEEIRLITSEKEKDTVIQDNTEEVVNSEGIEETPLMYGMRKANTVETPIDIVFIIQSDGTVESFFDQAKVMIEDVVELVNNDYTDIQVCLIKYGENDASYVGTYSYPLWMHKAVYVKRALEDIVFSYTSAYCNRGAAFNLLMNDLDFRENAAKFVYYIPTGNASVQGSFLSQLELCAERNVIYSEILSPYGYYESSSYADMVDAAIKKTKGINVRYSTDIVDVIHEHIVQNTVAPKVQFEAILPTGWNKITLENIISPKNGANSDSDTLTDWQEINTELISWNADGSINLPTLEECAKLTKKPYAEEGLVRFMESKSTSAEGTSPYMEAYRGVMKAVRVLPIHADPTMADSDWDMYDDDEEMLIYGSNPLQDEVHSFSLEESYISIDTPDDTTVHKYSNGAYGGNQGWFYSESDPACSDWDSEIITRGGCGIIASCDLLLYLQKSQDIKLTEVDTTSRKIDYSEYDKFVRGYVEDYLRPIDLQASMVDSITREETKVDRPYFTTDLEDAWYDMLDDINYEAAKGVNQAIVDAVSGGTGTWGVLPPSVATTLNQYVTDVGQSSVVNMISRDANLLEMEEVQEMLADSLNNNIPGILMIGLKADVYFGYSIENQMEYKMVPHFVVVTGMKIDEVIGKTTVEFSTWSKKAYLDLQNYLENPGILGAVVVNVQ